MLRGLPTGHRTTPCGWALVRRRILVRRGPTLRTPATETTWCCRPRTCRTQLRRTRRNAPVMRLLGLDRVPVLLLVLLLPSRLGRLPVVWLGSRLVG